MKIKCVVLAALAALFVALPAAAQFWVRVVTFDSMRKPVPGPATTIKLLAVLAPVQQCSHKCIVTRDGNVIDIAFPMLDGCLSITPPPLGEEGYFGYLPAGTYTARQVLVYENGKREITASLTFEVFEAGPPADIPTLSHIALAALAIILGAIAIKRAA